MYYTKLTDFASKDALLSGNPSKLVRGTELGAEFDAIATAIATKYDSATLGASSGSSLVGFIQSGTGAVSTTVQAKLRETVSVMDFIPSGTNTATTDVSGYITAALGTYGVHKTVIVPAGTYLLNSGISLGIHKALIGAGSSVVTFNFDSVDTIAIQGDSFSHIEGINITNITAAGNKTGIASYTPTVANGWRNGVVRDIVLYDFYVGIGSTQGLVQGLMFQNIYERVRIYNANDGVQMGAGSNANTFINCEFWNCVRALNLNNVTSQTFIGCGFEGSTTYDFYADTSYNIKFESCYFEPARGGIFSAATGSFDNCHSTNFATATTRFLGHLSGSYATINDFTDYNVGGVSVATQEYYKSLDTTGQVIAVNCRVRTGTEKTIPPALDGVIVSCIQSGDWLITKWGNGLMTLDCNTNISTNTVIMVAAVTSYSATLTLPDSFKDGAYAATANICFNGTAGFLLVDSPTIAVRPKTATTIDIAAQRATSVAVDGYFYSIRCVGLWK